MKPYIPRSTNNPISRHDSILWSTVIDGWIAGVKGDIELWTMDTAPIRRSAHAVDACHHTTPTTSMERKHP